MAVSLIFFVDRFRHTFVSTSIENNTGCWLDVLERRQIGGIFSSADWIEEKNCRWEQDFHKKISIIKSCKYKYEIINYYNAEKGQL